MQIEKQATFLIMAKKKNAETKPVVVQRNELAANCDYILAVRQIGKMLFAICGVQVIIDRDLAALYSVGTKQIITTIPHVEIAILVHKRAVLRQRITLQAHLTMVEGKQ